MGELLFKRHSCIQTSFNTPKDNHTTTSFSPCITSDSNKLHLKKNFVAVEGKIVTIFTLYLQPKLDETILKSPKTSNSQKADYEFPWVCTTNIIDVLETNKKQNKNELQNHLISNYSVAVEFLAWAPAQQDLLHSSN